MTQALYAHMNNKRKKKTTEDTGVSHPLEAYYQSEEKINK
jgi:hypothetical protein